MPLVVGGGPVGVDLREDRRPLQLPRHLLPARIRGGQGVGGDVHLGVHPAAVGEVGEDLEAGPGPREGLDPGGDGLGHAVHGVGPHGVPDVDQEVDDEHRAGPGLGGRSGARGPPLLPPLPGGDRGPGWRARGAPRGPPGSAPGRPRGRRRPRAGSGRSSPARSRSSGCRPRARIRRAELLAAATTEGSSIAMGISRSRPSIRKLAAMPRGKGRSPTTFSIIRSASSRPNPVAEARISRSSGVRSTRSAIAARRSAGGRR